MKKIIFAFFFVILMYNSTYARDLYEKELPSKFREECFEFSSSYNFLNKEINKYKIELNKLDTIAVRDGYLVPIIPYKISGENYNYSSQTFPELNFITDNNKATFLEIDTEENKEIIINFTQTLKKNSFGLKFKHSAENYAPEIFISEDGKKFSPVTFSSLYDFDIKILKIKFIEKNQEAKREKIKIFELSFNKEKNIKLMRIDGGGRVDFYSNYNCTDYINLNTIHIPFEIDVNTQKIVVELKKNPNYNPNIDKDTDGDNIDNYEDNCLEVYNPLQKDSDADGKGDKCSDVDGDGFLGYKDNCPTIANPDQADLNLNNIGDVCEFDKDNDGIFDSIDNCITVKNALQKDSDHDGIGDMCDNCRIFNPTQKDEDGNKIGDVCDSENKILAENDDDNDKIINGKDNCKNVANPDQKDTDKDGIGDACDNCIKVMNKTQYDFNKNDIGDICEDSDGDGITGIEDNCMNVVNPDQKDSDNDGIGDVCEDEDGDQIWFSMDNCPMNYNPLQKDIDDDGIGDICDEQDDRMIESNKTVFTAILIIISLIFGGGIYMMIQKLKGNSGGLNENKIKTKKSKTVKKKVVKIDGKLVESYTARKKRESEK